MRIQLCLDTAIDGSVRKTWYFVSPRAVLIKDLVADIVNTLGLPEASYLITKDEIPIHPNLYTMEMLRDGELFSVFQTTPAKAQPTRKHNKKARKKGTDVEPFSGRHVRFDDPPHKKTPDYARDGLPKQGVKRFGEFSDDTYPKITEVYAYNLQDFVPATADELQVGQTILFKTLELNEETLTPAMSDFKVRSP